MEDGFDPKQFVAKMDSGAYDGHLQDEIHKLSYEQLEKIVILITRRQRDAMKEPKPPANRDADPGRA
ncbi:MAG TPA: hypothetical protein VMB85_25220 [Bryobacteraceae bacterium]|nr:hypothetical protein [Bryobacteraceae bacterium]